MKRIGSAIIVLGAGVGIVAALGIGGVFHLALPWIVNVGLAKLALATSGGLMAGGAFVRRIGLRREHDSQLLSSTLSKLPKPSLSKTDSRSA